MAKKDKNPYALFNFDDDDATAAEKTMSKRVTVQITKILKQTSKFPNCNLAEQAEKIKLFDLCNVGIGDTSTDENIAAVLEEMLNAKNCIWNVEEIGQIFYHLIHS